MGLLQEYVENNVVEDAVVEETTAKFNYETLLDKRNIPFTKENFIEIFLLLLKNGHVRTQKDKDNGHVFANQRELTLEEVMLNVFVESAANKIKVYVPNANKLEVNGEKPLANKKTQKVKGEFTFDFE